MTYKDVCGSESCVWFELLDMKKEGRKFLQWAKDLGCVWLNRVKERTFSICLFTLMANSPMLLCSLG